MSEKTPKTPTPAEPKPRWYKRIPWKKVGGYGLPILVAVVAAVAVAGLLLPDEAKDPTARSGVATLKQDNAGLHTEVIDLTKKQGDLTGRTIALETRIDDPVTGLVARTDGLAKNDEDLQAAIDLRPTKTDVDSQVGAEIAAREAADTALSAAVEGIAKALHDPADPSAGVVGRIIAIEEHFSPPPPAPPPDQVGIHIRRPVR